MLELGIIQQVTEPTAWCSPMVPVIMVIEKNEKVRICVDLKRLNKSGARERYTFTLPILADVLHKLSGSKAFSTLDASSGVASSGVYIGFPIWEILLQASPIWNFQCIRNISMENGEAGQKYFPCVEVIMDDILVHAPDDPDHDMNLEECLKTVHNSGLRLNKDKCKFRQTQL